MLIVRFAFRCHPGRADDAVAALIPVVAASRALPGVISIDIARDITDPDAFIATELYDDRAALDRQEALPETVAALAALKNGIVAESDALIHHVTRSERFA
jgi:quinol monooxygenase YgiN